MQQADGRATQQAGGMRNQMVPMRRLNGNSWMAFGITLIIVDTCALAGRKLTAFGITSIQTAQWLQINGLEIII